MALTPSLLFSTSYSSAKLPADWRTANITAVHKKAIKRNLQTTDSTTNYSLTSVICKIMESIVRDIIMDNFLLNGFFSDYQYGFIKGRSAVLQLLKIVDHWTFNLDHGLQIDVIYAEFEKAFDKVPRQALISVTSV